MSIPAGWYPNPDGSPNQRWWDGGAWSERVSEPSSTAAPVSRLAAPAGTSPYTAWVWVIVGVEALNLIIAIVSAIVTPHTIEAVTSRNLTVWSLLQSALQLALLVLLIVAAFRDASDLRRRGVPRPFSAGWIFFELMGAPVYMIGRAVVARRRTGSGLAPMWIYLALRIAGWIVGGIVLALVLPQLNDYIQEQLAEIDSLSSQ